MKTTTTVLALLALSCSGLCAADGQVMTEASNDASGVVLMLADMYRESPEAAATDKELDTIGLEVIARPGAVRFVSTNVLPAVAASTPKGAERLTLQPPVPEGFVLSESYTNYYDWPERRNDLLKIRLVGSERGIVWHKMK